MARSTQSVMNPRFVDSALDLDPFLSFSNVAKDGTPITVPLNECPIYSGTFPSYSLPPPFPRFRVPHIHMHRALKVVRR